MITVEIIGTERVAAMFRDRSARCYRALSTELRRLVIDLAGIVKGDYLSGQVLKNRSGRLRRSINASPVTEDAQGISATVGTNVSYARVHELGLSVSIPSQTRSRRSLVTGWNKSWIKRRDASWSVRAYTANYPERAFLRPALEGMRSDIRNRLNAAMTRALAGSA